MLEPDPDPDNGPWTQAESAGRPSTHPRSRPRAEAGCPLDPDRPGRAWTAPVVGPDGNQQSLPAPVRLVDRGDHFGDRRQLRAVRDNQRRPPRHGVAGHPRVRHPALNLHPDLLRRDDHTRLARVPQPIVDDPGPLILRHGAIDHRQRPARGARPHYRLPRKNRCHDQDAQTFPTEPRPGGNDRGRQRGKTDEMSTCFWNPSVDMNRVRHPGVPFLILKVAGQLS